MTHMAYLAGMKFVSDYPKPIDLNVMTTLDVEDWEKEIKAEFNFKTRINFLRYHIQFPENKRSIDTKWVFKKKRNLDG